jgi:hypothetical protein
MLFIHSHRWTVKISIFKFLILNSIIVSKNVSVNVNLKKKLITMMKEKKIYAYLQKYLKNS